MTRLLSGPRRWWLLGGVVALLVLALGWLLLVTPQQSAADAAVKQAEQVEQQVAIGTAQNSQLAKQNAEMETVKKQLQELQNRIPDSEQVSALLVSANNLAGASGLALTAFSPSPVSALDTSAPDKGTAKLGYITVVISGKGGFSQVQDYLSKLENLDRAMIVTSVDLSQGTTTGSGSGSGTQPDPGAAGEYSVTINARVFVRGDAVPAPTPQTKPKGQ